MQLSIEEDEEISGKMVFLESDEESQIQKMKMKNLQMKKMDQKEVT